LDHGPTPALGVGDRASSWRQTQNAKPDRSQQPQRVLLFLKKKKILKLWASSIDAEARDLLFSPAPEFFRSGRRSFSHLNQYSESTRPDR
jgi:hypothetical protein